MYSISMDAIGLANVEQLIESFLNARMLQRFTDPEVCW